VPGHAEPGRTKLAGNAAQKANRTLPQIGKLLAEAAAAAEREEVAHQTSSAVTSLAASQAAPAQVAGWIRGHWGIEAIHHIRDVTCAEDASQIRTGNGPQVTATLRNLGIAILKPTGHGSIAAACRYHARDATRTLTILGLSPG